MPYPEAVTLVAPVRFVPVSVTGTVVPLTPVLGVIDVRVGAGAETTVNVTVLLAPPGVVMETVRAESVAVAETANVAVTLVGPTTVKPLTVTPVPETVIAVAPVRFVPVRVIGTVAPCAPEVGAIEVSVGAPGEVTVNVTVLLGPPGVVMVTVRAETVAVPAIVKVAVAVVALTTVRPLTVTPVPETATAVAPVRFVPVSVTGTLVPRTPEIGEIELSVGAGTLAVTLPAT